MKSVVRDNSATLPTVYVFLRPIVRRAVITGLVFVVLEFASAIFQFTRMGSYTVWDFFSGFAEIPLQIAGWVLGLFLLGAAVSLFFNAFAFLRILGAKRQWQQCHPYHRLPVNTSTKVKWAWKMPSYIQPVPAPTNIG